MANKTVSLALKPTKEIFSVHRVPRSAIADNIPYHSLELRFKKTEPYYPKAIGLAEKAVGITKTNRKDIGWFGRHLFCSLTM